MSPTTNRAHIPTNGPKDAVPWDKDAVFASCRVQSWLACGAIEMKGIPAAGTGRFILETGDILWEQIKEGAVVGMKPFVTHLLS